METMWVVLSQLVLLYTVSGSLVNVALNKPTAMSSNEGGYNPSEGVDGDTNANGYTSDLVVHTAIRRTFGWWRVDLQQVVDDAEVKIYFRTDFKVRRNGVQLYTSTSSFSSYPEGQLCDTVRGRADGTDIPDVYSVTCSGRWRYLLLYTNIANNGQGPVLDFGEVQVLVCSSGNYGEDCMKSCVARNCVTMTTTCERDGRCPGGCQFGWTGVDCTQVLPPCENGNYGLNCEKSCSDRKCKASQQSGCNRLTGQCPAGCQDGWRQLDCILECFSGSYGPNCGLQCSNRKCFDSLSSCDHVTGVCLGGCQDGYREQDCRLTCAPGYYGSRCLKSCNDRKCIYQAQCDHVTGQCINGLCMDGYKGLDCREPCGPGTYGSRCSLSCSDRNCSNSLSSCDHVTGQCIGGCKAGYQGTNCIQQCAVGTDYGINCSKSCSDRRCSPHSFVECNIETGRCPNGCVDGWNGEDCTIQCPDDTYGMQCKLCRSRKCQGESDCPADGTCSQGCQDGWTGHTCTEECPVGFYGPGCNMTCGNCSSGPVCDHVTGNCDGSCAAGWRSDRCDQVCLDGTYGPDCTETCGNCEGVCEIVNGTCPAGCREGFNGTRCEVSLAVNNPQDPSSVVVPAVAGAVAALVVIAIVIIVIIFLRRRRNKRPPNAENQKLDQSTTAPDAKSKKKAQSYDNVYVNVAMDNEEPVKEKKAVQVTSKPVVPQKPKRDEKDDQSEEILDEDEAPGSKTYYNIEEEEVIREVAVEDLEATVQKIKHREGGFEAEFSRLPSGFTTTYADSQKEENSGKNKFRGYYPYDYNRVRLSLIPDVPGSDYINASIMHNIDESKTYIAAQAPKKTTLGDFWRMIWEQRCGRIVMLTNLVEDMKAKCYQYWPQKEELSTDHFRVILEDTNIRADFTIRTMKVEEIETGESRTVVQYHYTTWPDHGVPDTLALVNFIWMMRRTHKQTDGPLLVHCSAGIGRTGTYIAVDSLLDQAQEEGKVDVQGFVSIMRGQRKNMIQTKNQYECVFQCLVEMTKYGNTSLPVDDFTTLYTNSGMDGQVHGKSFRELVKLMSIETNSDAPIKNQMWVDGNQNFIIRTAPSLRKVKGHMLCVSPKSSTEKLLWKLVEENDVNNIIAVSNLKNAEKGKTKTIGAFKLTTTDLTRLTPTLCLLTLDLQNQDRKNTVKILQFEGSVSVESLSESFLEHSQLKLMVSDLSPTVVIHGDKEIKLAATMSIMGNLLSEIQEDQIVDVLHQVRVFTNCFPDITLSQSDVEELFEFAKKCAQLSASTYANM